MSVRPNLGALREQLLAGNLNTVLTRYSDILLAGLVIAIIGIMIVPVPPFLLDLFLAANITLGVTLLMITLYVPDALALASFPSLLLVTTLFRLALNVSSTRLILLHGYAGEVIESFGNFVVQGNFIVGFVMFLVLTLIQFIVIAKGAERVSEVAARFTLDAMPGKQMSIDADLRAGLIEVADARRRRDNLSRESQFHGAMDGAMKFVKGDAIAGILISIINIAAGLAIGVLVKGYPVGTAAKKYTLLTIGDGLVSQIPSLIIATAAGILTTRVASSSDDGPSSLGQEIGVQLLAQPRAMAIAAGMLVGLGLIPGLPTIPFLALAGATGGLAWGLSRTHQTKDLEKRRAEVMETPAARQQAGEEARRLPMTIPVLLETGAAVTPLVDVAVPGARFIQELVPQMREWLFQDLGVSFPGVKVRGDAAHLPEDGYVIYINEVPAASGALPAGGVFVADGAEQLLALGVRGLPAPHPAGQGQGLWLQAEDAARLPARTGGLLRPDEYMALHLAHVLKANVDDLLGLQDVQNLLELLEQQGYEALVKSVVPRPLSVQRLTDVLRRLLREEISIRNLQAILEALAEGAAFESDPVFLTEHVRRNLQAYIAFKHTAGRPVLPVYLLDPKIEEIVQGGIRPSAAGSSLSLDPGASRMVLEGFRRAFSRLAAGARPIVLTQSDVRYFVKRLLGFEFPQTVVLSFQELPSDLQIQPVGRVELAAGALAEAAV